MDAKNISKLKRDVVMFSALAALALAVYALALSGTPAPATRRVDPNVREASVGANPMPTANYSTPPTDRGPGNKTVAQGRQQKPTPAASDPPIAAEEQENVSVPLVFAQVPVDFIPSPEQQAEIEWMRQTFVSTVGEPGQDPEGYRLRWQAAQQWQNEHFKLMFGEDLFNEFQQEAETAPNGAE